MPKHLSKRCKITPPPLLRPSTARIWLLSLAVGACKPTAPAAAPFIPAFLRVRVALSGVGDREAFGTQLKQYAIRISGCESYPEDNVLLTLESAKEKRSINLHAGNRGCTAALESFAYGTPGETETFRLAAGAEDEAADHLSYEGGQSGQRFIVSPGKILNSPLEHFEELSFYLMPAYGDNADHVYASMVDLPEGETTTVRMRLGAIKDDGPVGDKERGIYVRFDCDEVRTFDRCAGARLLDYRFKLLPHSSPEPDYDALGARMRGQEPIIRATKAHIKGNGLAFYLLVPHAADESLAPDILAVIQLGKDYRYFVVHLRDEVLPAL